MGQNKDKNIFSTVLKFLILFQIVCIIPLAVMQLSTEVEWMIFSVTFLLSIPSLILAFITLWKSSKLPTRKGKTTGVVSLIIELPIAALIVHTILDVGWQAIDPIIIILFFFVNVIVAGIIFFIVRRKNVSKNVKDGIQSTEKNVLSETEESNSLRPLKNLSKKAVRSILCSLVILIIAISLLTTWHPIKKAFAVKCANELQSMLKDPTSLLIRGDIFVIKNEENIKLAIIEYSAANSYGGMVANVAFFSDDLGYLGSYDSDISEMTGHWRSEYTDAKIYYGISEIADSHSSSNIVSGKSVAKSVGCNYSPN